MAEIFDWSSSYMAFKNCTKLARKQIMPSKSFSGYFPPHYFIVLHFNPYQRIKINFFCAIKISSITQLATLYVKKILKIVK